MKKRTLADINADVLSKDRVIAEYENVINIMKTEKETLETEKKKFILDNYCISLRVRKHDLEIYIKAGFLGFISEMGRAFILTDEGQKKRFEELHALGWGNFPYENNTVTWRGRDYFLKVDEDDLLLCSGLPGEEYNGYTAIFNFRDGVPCTDCEDENIDRYSNGTVKIYGGKLDNK